MIGLAQVLHFAPMRRTGIGLALLAVLCAGVAGGVMLAGCGGDDSGDGDQALSAQETARAYVDAQNTGDFARVCALLGDPLRQQLGGDNCVNFLKEQTSGAPRHTYRLVNVGATPDEGTAYIVTRGETGKPVNLSLFLARRDGEWKIVGSGPTSPPGKPEPHD
jgi:hypothetical protein